MGVDNDEDMANGRPESPLDAPYDDNMEDEGNDSDSDLALVQSRNVGFPRILIGN